MPEVNPPDLTYRALTKMTFGATPSLIDYVKGLAGTELDAVHAFIDEQLDPMNIDDSVMDGILLQYQTLGKSRQQLYQEHVYIPDVDIAPYSARNLSEHEVYFSTYAYALHSKRQVLEKMVGFWRNHFSVYSKTPWVGPMLPEYEGILRENSLGNFQVFLKKIVLSFCMLRYLGNDLNEESAPNENYARELLELHTLGAENYYKLILADDVPEDDAGRKTGYVEEDVLEVARLLTGYSQDVHYVSGSSAPTGEFEFISIKHDFSSKVIMGQMFEHDAESENQLKELDDLLDLLCEHPLTSQFLAKKLCEYFIGDHPLNETIVSVATVLHENWQSPDQIKLAMEVLLKSPDFLATWGEKIKTPMERIVGTMRCLSYDYTFPPLEEGGIDLALDKKTDLHHSYIESAGLAMYQMLTPNGYSFDENSLLSSLYFMGTWKAQQYLSTARRDQLDPVEHPGFDVTIAYNKVSDETALAFPDENDRTPNNMVTYWYKRVCGVVPDEETRSELVKYMSYHYNQEVLSNGDPDDPFDVYNHSYALGYKKEQLSSMVAMITMSSEFFNK